MNDLDHSSRAAACRDDTLITEELARRPSRAPDHAAENRALVALAQEMATDPGSVLRKLAELVVGLCRADSAGVGTLEPGGENGLLRWHAAAGAFAANLGGTMPWDASPCGTVMASGRVLLFDGAGRLFPALGGVELRIHESLLAPWRADGEVVGALWAVKHAPEGRFDAEDARLLESLARFASAAHRVAAALDAAEAGRAELERHVEERQAFLLKLGDALRPLADAQSVQAEVARRLGAHLGADRVFYAAVGDDGVAVIGAEHRSGDAPSVAGRRRLDDFGLASGDTLRAGRTLVIPDVGAWSGLTDTERQAHRALGIAAQVKVPLVKAGRLVAFLGVHQLAPRHWTAAEVSLVAEVVECTWAAVERVHAEARLRESEARLRFIVENARDHAILVADPEGRITDWLPGAQAVFGWAAEAAVGRPAAMIFTPEDREQGVPERELETARRDGAAPNVRWHLREDGSRVFIQGTVAAVRDAGGELRGFLKIGQDVTERHGAEERLRRSEALFRTLATGIQALVFRGGPDGWRTWPSPQWVGFTGLGFEDSLGLGWLEAVHPEDREATLAAWREAAGLGEYYAEHRIRHAAGGAWRWHQTRARPLDGAGGEWVGATTDVHDLRELQGRQGVLVAELQHRTRNLLAVVRSLAEKTMAGAASPDEFRDVFRDRLSALSRVQGLLSRLAEGERVKFDGLVRTELTALGALGVDGRGPQVVLDGPEGVRLRSGTVQTFALALHELATNAVKYGALSRPEGRLLVRWRVDCGDDGERRLHVDWRESGVAMPEAGAAPRGGGYGRELIERALPYQLQARTRFELGPEGVRCSIAVPVPAEETEDAGYA